VHHLKENAAGEFEQFEQSLKANDGCDIHFRLSRPAAVSRHAVLLFHRGHEHSGRLGEVVRDLNLKDTWLFAWDARGHGKSTAPLRSFDQLVIDARQFIAHISQAYDIPVENISVVAHSFSAVALIDCLLKYKHPISSLILLAPTFSINLFVPGAWSILRTLHAVTPNISIPSYVSGRMLTRSKEEALRYDQDQSITRTIPLSVLLQLNEAGVRALEQAQQFNVPTLVLTAGNDLVAGVSEQRQFFNSLCSEGKAMKTFPAVRHDMFHELERDDLLRAIKDYALAHFAASKNNQ